MISLTKASALVLLVWLGACGSPTQSPSPDIPASDDIVQGTAVDQTDLPAARQVLLDYFEMRSNGQENQAADFWCNRSNEGSIGSRLESLTHYRTNIAAPLMDGQGGASISLQLLTPENASLLDAVAFLEQIAPDAERDWCIRRITLQQRPVPLSGQ